MKSEIKYASDPRNVRNYTTEKLREEFLVEELFEDDQVKAVYSLFDRMIIMGIRPVNSHIQLDAFEDLTKSVYFLQRRELGVINVGGSGTIAVDGTVHTLNKKECLLISGLRC